MVNDQFEKLLSEHIRALDSNTKAITDSNVSKTGPSNSGGGGGSIDPTLGLMGILSAAGEAVKQFSTAVIGAAVPLFVVSKVVGSINPQVVDTFMESIGNLTATIGTALLPIIEVFTGVINQVSGVLLPVMQELAPIFKELAEIVGGVLITVIKVFADIIIALKPVIMILMAAFKAVAEIISLVVTVMGSLLSAILSSLFGKDDVKEIKDMFQQFANAIKQIIVYMTLLVASFAKFIGMGSIVQKFKDEIDKKIKPVGGGARSVTRTDASIEGLNSITNKIAVNAANALPGGAGAPEDPNLAALKEISNGLAEILGTNQNLQKTITAGVKDAINPFGPAQPAFNPNNPPQPKGFIDGLVGV